MNTQWIQLGRSDLRVELQQLTDEGISGGILDEMQSIAAVEGEEGIETRREVADLLDRAEELAPEVDYPYREPSNWVAIREAAPGPPGGFGSLSDSVAADRIHGAWLGRCAGCLLGKPVEGWTSKRLRGYLEAIGGYPLSGYIPAGTSEQARSTFEISDERAFIDRIDDGMPEDDDTNYTTLNFVLVEKGGTDFSAADVGRLWMGRLPILHTFTAERIAYRNLVEGYGPPRSARRRNPCREWIGAQIRADMFGYLNIGRPSRAAEWAHRDASVSHVKNGIYGEMWVAAMLAVAPFTSDPREVIEGGLSVLPANSRLVGAVRDVLSWRETQREYDDVVSQIHRIWDETNGHHWCHTISNAQIVAVGLLWGDGDLGTSICRAVQPGFDTDCNGATVGSIFGMMHGSGAIPSEWSQPLADTLHTGVAGYHRVAISEMADATFRLSGELA